MSQQADAPKKKRSYEEIEASVMRRFGIPMPPPPRPGPDPLFESLTSKVSQATQTDPPPAAPAAPRHQTQNAPDLDQEVKRLKLALAAEQKALADLKAFLDRTEAMLALRLAEAEAPGVGGLRLVREQPGSTLRSKAHALLLLMHPDKLLGPARPHVPKVLARILDDQAQWAVRYLKDACL